MTGSRVRRRQKSRAGTGRPEDPKMPSVRSTPTSAARGGFQRAILLALALVARASAGPMPFLSAQGIGGLTHSDSVVAGDFNGDGRIDMAALSYGNEVIWIESVPGGFV